jgi:hypothetical protein
MEQTEYIYIYQRNGDEYTTPILDQAKRRTDQSFIISKRWDGILKQINIK